jgi:putative ABC transport system permease protein
VAVIVMAMGRADHRSIVVHWAVVIGRRRLAPRRGRTRKIPLPTGIFGTVRAYDPPVWLPALIWTNLMRRRARSLLTAVGVALGVGLIVALLSISAGVQLAVNNVIHLGGADFGLFQGQVTQLTNSLLPDRLVGQVASNPGVQEAAHIKLLVTTVDGKGSQLVFGLDPTEFPERQFVIVKGTRAPGNQVLLGDHAASQMGKGPGSTVTIGNTTLPVTGIFHSGNNFEDSAVVAPLALVQQWAGRPGEVTSIGIIVRPGVASSQVASQLERQYPGLVAITNPGQAIQVDTTSKLLISAGWVFSVVALLVGGIGVTNTMAMSVMERSQEIGVLRAVGWPNRRVAGMIASEAVAICLLALGIGLLLGWVAAQFLVAQGALSQLVTPQFGLDVFAWGLAFSLGVGMLGAAYPVWRAVRVNPIEALRRE